MRRACSLVLPSMASSARAALGSSRPALRDTCAQLRMALNGDRSSCDRVARNRSFARFASSASPRALSAAARAACSAARSASRSAVARSRSSTYRRTSPKSRPIDATARTATTRKVRLAARVAPRASFERCSSRSPSFRSIRVMMARTRSISRRPTPDMTTRRAPSKLSLLRNQSARRSPLSRARTRGSSASGAECGKRSPGPA